MPKLRNPLRRTYSPNQIVALNVGRARALRGWTQEQAAELLDLPFSTYRRHLKTGMEQLTQMLWQREIGG